MILSVCNEKADNYRLLRSEPGTTCQLKVQSGHIRTIISTGMQMTPKCTHNRCPRDSLQADGSSTKTNLTCKTLFSNWKKNLFSCDSLKFTLMRVWWANCKFREFQLYSPLEVLWNWRQHIFLASAARPACEMMELEVRQRVHKSVSGPVPEYTSDRVLSCEASEPQCCQVEGR